MNITKDYAVFGRYDITLEKFPRLGEVEAGTYEEAVKKADRMFIDENGNSIAWMVVELNT